jgi:hypothetical protein
MTAKSRSAIDPNAGFLFAIVAKERDMTSSSSRFSVTVLLICCLLLAFAATTGAKPRKKSKKQKEAAERVRREAAAQWAALSQLVAARTSVPDVTSGGLGVNSGIATSAASSQSSVNAQFIGDPEAPHPGPAPAAGTLIISEFRLRGPSGANDEFIEIYNNSGADHTVTASSGTGYGVAASDGVLRCTIPNATVIPAGGHFLCTNSVAYSLGGYATADATYAVDIPDNAGIALFNNNVIANFTLANRFDAVGSTSEANTLYKEGTGYPALTPFSIDYSFYRDTCGKSGSITTFNPCTISTPKDTDDNAADFIFVDTNGTSAGAGQRLGAPGPENLASPIQRNATIANALLDATVDKANPPNQVRDFTSVPAQNSTFGTLSLRRRFVNNTGANVTRLRFRVIDITAFPAPSGFADLRPRTSSSVVVAGINDSVTCTAAGQATPCTVTVNGTTLETPPSQPNGGAFNSSLSAGTITLGTPLANGASIDVQFLLGIQQTGLFKIYVNIEALP